MAGSLNKVCLIGNLGRDPESRSFQSGDKVVSFSIATSESWNDKASGERKEKTEWHNIAVFNSKLGEVAEKFLKKGSKVYLEGQIQSRKYQDRDNVERTAYEIVVPRFGGILTLLDRRESGDGDSDRGSYSNGGRSNGASGGGRGSQTNGYSNGQGGNQANGGGNGWGRNAATGGGASTAGASTGGGWDKPTTGSKYNDMDDDIPF